MSAEDLRVNPEEVLLSYALVDFCVPSDTVWDREERRRAAFSLYLLEVDPGADLFHIRKGEEISVNYALPAVAKLYAEFSTIYDRHI